MEQATISGRIPRELSVMGDNFCAFLELNLRDSIANLKFETQKVISSLMKIQLRRDGKIIFSTIMDCADDTDKDADRLLEKYGVQKIMFLDFLFMTLKVIIDNAPPHQDIMFKITADVDEVFIEVLEEIMTC